MCLSDLLCIVVVYVLKISNLLDSFILLDRAVNKHFFTSTELLVFCFRNKKPSALDQDCFSFYISNEIHYLVVNKPFDTKYQNHNFKETLNKYIKKLP